MYLYVVWGAFYRLFQQIDWDCNQSNCHDIGNYYIGQIHCGHSAE